jgi:hypothetical protein
MRFGRRVALAGAGAGAAGLSTWAAMTNPFTAGANAVSALSLFLVVSAAGLRWRRARTAPALRSGTGMEPWWPWAAFFLVVVAWELTCLFLGPRVDHPTLSSLYNSAARLRPVRGACFFAWLCLGAALVRT